MEAQSGAEVGCQVAQMEKRPDQPREGRPGSASYADFGAGIGIGLRSQHAAEFIKKKPCVDWLEVLADNYLSAGGIEHQHLDCIRQDYPIALHSVGMSIGGSAELNWDYLKQLKDLGKRYDCSCFSDHLCFTSVGDKQMHDLLPLPRNEEAVKHVAARIRRIQDFLGQSMLVENISAYLQYKHSDLSEADFLNAVCAEAKCFLLLDVNNLYVNQRNHGIAADETMAGIRAEYIRAIHLGGFEDYGNYLLDAHNNPVADAVWDLYVALLRQGVQAATLIEWDNALPPLSDLLAEADKARHCRELPHPAP